MAAAVTIHADGLGLDIEGVDTIRVDTDRGYICMDGRRAADWPAGEARRVARVVDRAFPDAGLGEGEWFICDAEDVWIADQAAKRGRRGC